MNARHVRVIALQELRGLGREKTIVSAILLQLFIALFSSFLMVGLVAMYDPAALGPASTEFNIGVSGAGDDLEDLMDAGPGLRPRSMPLGDAMAALREGRLSAVVYVPDTPPDAEEPILVTIWLVENDIRSSLVAASLKEVLGSFEQEIREVRADRLEHRAIPLEFPPMPSGGGYYEFLYGLLIPLLLFLPAIISGALVIDSITEEFQHRTLETLLSTPVSFPDVLRGKVLAAWVLVPVQAGAWMLLLAANGIGIASPAEMLLHASLVALVLILAGSLVALYYRERSTSQFVFSIGLIALMLVVLAIPENPVNLVVRLAVGAAGPAHWLMLGAEAAVAALLAVLVAMLARRVIGPGRLRNPDARSEET